MSILSQASEPMGYLVLARDLATLKRWSPHFTFGLRTEWIDLVLRQPETWPEAGVLGSKQVPALKAWLSTIGMRESGSTGAMLLRRLFSEPDSRPLAWQVAWVNATHNFALATYYVWVLGLGQWTTSEIMRSMNAARLRISPRTVKSGVTELASFLERTPVGTQLGQGVVEPTRPRTVRRLGLASPHPIALAHAARRLFLRERRHRLLFVEDQLWPWTVFGCDPYEARALLRFSDQAWLRLDEQALEATLPMEELGDVALF